MRVANCFLICTSDFARAADQPPAQPVATLRAVWHDAARDRDVPVKIYNPEKNARASTARAWSFFKGADHMTFALERLICAASTAFFDAQLRGNAGARAWLYGGGFAQQLDGEGTFAEKIRQP